MTRVRLLSPQEVEDPDLRSWMAASGDQMYGVYGHCPELLKPLLQFYGPIKYGGRLPIVLKELVRLRIADLNACHR